MTQPPRYPSLGAESELVTPDGIAEMDNRLHGDVGEAVASALLQQALENRPSRVTVSYDGDTADTRVPELWSVRTPEGSNGWVPDAQIRLDRGEHTVLLESKSGDSLCQDNQKTAMEALAERPDVTVVLSRVRFVEGGFEVTFSRLTAEAGGARWERVFVADLAGLGPERE